MRNISPVLFTALLLILNLSSGYGQVDLVLVTITEESADSVGPWTYQIQEIDSLNSGGLCISKLRRQWNGSDWENSKSETIQYNSSNLITEITKYISDGTNMLPQIKTENSYDTFGNLLTEINYQFSGNNWIAGTKREHFLSQQLKDSSVQFSNFIAGNWNLSEQLIFSYNSNTQISSDIRMSWNGSNWDTLQLNKYYYDPGLQKRLFDSTYYYSSSLFLLTNSVEYHYSSAGLNTQRINRNHYSYLYSDQDTSYTESEIDFEYSTNILYNSLDQPIELHGLQTKGSNQNWTFEHKYFQYNSNGRQSVWYSHQGTNLTESFLKQSSYEYHLLNATFKGKGKSYIGSTNGTVVIIVAGGVPPYHIESISGQINGMNINYLSSGIHSVCVIDAIGNKVCANINIEEFTSGLDKPDEDLNKFTVVSIQESSLIKVESRSQNIFSFILYDKLGRTIINKNNLNKITFLSTINLPAGTYYYHAFDKAHDNRGSIAVFRH